MKKLLMLVMFLSACTDDAKPTPLTCAEVGCGSAALCNRKGECTCPQGSGEDPVPCTTAGLGSAQ